MKNLCKAVLVFILRKEAALVLKKYKPHIIAVTGSVGKTSTKDAIFSVLAEVEHVRKSDKSFNSEIGIPLTILGRPNAWSNPLHWVQTILDGFFLILLPAEYPRWLVLEVGADRPGDISSLARWMSVDVAVITRLPDMPVHVEFFDSPQQVIEEKISLIDALKPGGVVVAYSDDQRIDVLRDKAIQKGARLITFGLSSAADVHGKDFVPLLGKEGSGSAWPIGMGATVVMQGTTAPIAVVGVLGSHTLLSAIAAAAVGMSLGYTLPDIMKGLATYEPPRGRMRILPGIKGTCIIDDTYNSSPAAVEAALNALRLLPREVRTIAVLGDMLELGRYSVDEHRKAGAIARHVDLLITVGFRARDIAQGALANGLADKAILQFEDIDKAGRELQAMLQKGDCVLVKGSQSTRMEKIVEEIMLEPERAKELLVRQEVDWKRR